MLPIVNATIVLYNKKSWFQVKPYCVMVSLVRLINLIEVNASNIKMADMHILANKSTKSFMMLNSGYSGTEGTAAATGGFGVGIDERKASVV